MKFDAKVEQLDNVLAYVEGQLEKHDVPAKIVVPYLVAVEEIFVNIASYAYTSDEGYADVDLEITDNKVQITFADEGIQFDPLKKTDPDITASSEEREIGGLGIYMVKKSMDGVNYERKDNLNILTFWKNY